MKLRYLINQLFQIAQLYEKPNKSPKRGDGYSTFYNWRCCDIIIFPYDSARYTLYFIATAIAAWFFIANQRS